MLELTEHINSLYGCDLIFNQKFLNYEFQIKDIFINRNAFQYADTQDSVIMNLLALYLEIVDKKYDEMKTYYLMAIEKGNSDAMNDFGFYYEEIEKDYEKAKKYYLMGIENGCSEAMNNLAHYYEEIEKDYNKAKKYYLMAIENGDLDAMINLADYYENMEKDYVEMKKYYFMAMESGWEDLNLEYNNNIDHDIVLVELYIMNNLNKYKNHIYQFVMKYFCSGQNIDNTPKYKNKLKMILDTFNYLVKKNVLNNNNYVNPLSQNFNDITIIV